MVLVSALLIFLTVVTVVGTAGLVGGVLMLGHLPARVDPWALALAGLAARLGFSFPPGGRSFRATVHGFELWIDTVATDDAGSEATRIRCGGPLPPTLEIRPWTATWVGSKGIRLGDPALDDLAQIRGPPDPEIRARMNVEARAVLVQAVKRGAVLHRGWWTMQCPELVLDPDRLLAFTSVLLRAAHVLLPADPMDGLQRIAATDPLPRVRRGALRSLLTIAEPGAWLAVHLADPDPQVSVVAATALGEDGRSALHALLDPGRPAIHREAALALARLEPGNDRSLVEDALLACLGDGDEDVMAALARIGTATSVPALAQLAGRRLGIGAVPRRAKEGIAAIQGRLVGAEAGALALTDDGAGGLAMADERRRD